MHRLTRLLIIQGSLGIPLMRFLYAAKRDDSRRWVVSVRISDANSTIQCIVHPLKMNLPWCGSGGG